MFIFLFPAFGDRIFGKFFFPRLKIGMMDPVSSPLCFDRRANAMEHLMIYDIGDKVRRKMRLIEQAMDFDPVCLKAVKAEFAMPPCSALGAPKPSDLQI